MPEKNKKRIARKYTPEYKKEVMELANEIGARKASEELGVPKSTIVEWLKAAKEGRIDFLVGDQTPAQMKLAIENQKLRAEIKAMAKANALLRKENAFLEEASAFFAASRQKLQNEK